MSLRLGALVYRLAYNDDGGRQTPMRVNLRLAIGLLSLKSLRDKALTVQLWPLSRRAWATPGCFSMRERLIGTGLAPGAQ